MERTNQNDDVPIRRLLNDGDDYVRVRRVLLCSRRTRIRFVEAVRVCDSVAGVVTVVVHREDQTVNPLTDEEKMDIVRIARNTNGAGRVYRKLVDLLGKNRVQLAIKFLEEVAK
jgi:hypothetical protein